MNSNETINQNSMQTPKQGETKVSKKSVCHF